MRPTFLYSFLAGFLASLLWMIMLDSLVLVLDRLIVDRLKDCVDKVQGSD